MVLTDRRPTVRSLVVRKDCAMVLLCAGYGVNNPLAGVVRFCSSLYLPVNSVSFHRVLPQCFLTASFTSSNARFGQRAAVTVAQADEPSRRRTCSVETLSTKAKMTLGITPGQVEYQSGALWAGQRRVTTSAMSRSLLAGCRTAVLFEPIRMWCSGRKCAKHT